MWTKSQKLPANFLEQEKEFSTNGYKINRMCVFNVLFRYEVAEFVRFLFQLLSRAEDQYNISRELCIQKNTLNKKCLNSSVLVNKTCLHSQTEKGEALF